MDSMPVFGGHESPASAVVPRWDGSEEGSSVDEELASAVRLPAQRLIELI